MKFCVHEEKKKIFAIINRAPPLTWHKIAYLLQTIQNNISSTCRNPELGINGLLQNIVVNKKSTEVKLTVWQIFIKKLTSFIRLKARICQTANALLASCWLVDELFGKKNLQPSTQMTRNGRMRKRFGSWLFRMRCRSIASHSIREGNFKCTLQVRICEDAKVSSGLPTCIFFDSSMAQLLHTVTLYIPSKYYCIFIEMLFLYVIPFMRYKKNFLSRYLLL